MVVYNLPKSEGLTFSDKNLRQERLKRYYHSLAVSAVSAEMQKILRELNPSRYGEETPEEAVSSFEHALAA